VTDSAASIEKENIDDVFTNFGKIDVSDCETLKDTITGPKTVASYQFKRAQDDDRSLDCYRTRGLAGSREYVVRNGLLYRRAGVSATAMDAACQPIMRPMIISHDGEPTDRDIKDPKTAPSGKARVTTGRQLTDGQRAQQLDWVERYKNVGTDRLGCSHTAKHRVRKKGCEI